MANKGAIALGVLALTLGGVIYIKTRAKKEEKVLYTETFYPDPHPEISSVDGYVTQTGEQTWASLIAALGNGSNDTWDGVTFVAMGAGYAAGGYNMLSRGIFLFDTSGLPDTAVITAGVLSLYGYGVDDRLFADPDVNIYSALPATNNDLVAGDFDSLGSTPFSTPILSSAWNLAGYNDFVLNAAGIAAISKVGVSKFGARNANYDVAGIPPPWIAGESSCIYCYMAEMGGVYRPKLVVKYYLSNPLIGKTLISPDIIRKAKVR